MLTDFLVLFRRVKPSSWSSDVIWRQASWSALVEVMACRLPDGIETLHKPIIAYHLVSSRNSLEDVLLTISSVSGGGSHVGVTKFLFQWITTELLMKSYIYWYFDSYPLLWSYCDIIVYSYFVCILFQAFILLSLLLLGSFRYVCINLRSLKIWLISGCNNLFSKSLYLIYNLYVSILSIGFMYHHPLMLFIYMFIF